MSHLNHLTIWIAFVSISGGFAVLSFGNLAWKTHEKTISGMIAQRFHVHSLLMIIAIAVFATVVSACVVLTAIIRDLCGEANITWVIVLGMISPIIISGILIFPVVVYRPANLLHLIPIGTFYKNSDENSAFIIIDEARDGCFKTGHYIVQEGAKLKKLREQVGTDPNVVGVNSGGDDDYEKRCEEITMTKLDAAEEASILHELKELLEIDGVPVKPHEKVVSGKTWYDEILDKILGKTKETWYEVKMGDAALTTKAFKTHKIPLCIESKGWSDFLHMACVLVGAGLGYTSCYTYMHWKLAQFQDNAATAVLESILIISGIFVACFFFLQIHEYFPKLQSRRNFCGIYTDLISTLFEGFGLLLLMISILWISYDAGNLIDFGASGEAFCAL